MEPKEVQDFYKRLGIERNSSEEQIKKVYKKLAKKYHPDISKNDGNMKAINEAHDTLTDKRKRTLYNLTITTNLNDLIRTTTYEPTQTEEQPRNIRNKLDTFLIKNIGLGGAFESTGGLGGLLAGLLMPAAIADEMLEYIEPTLGQAYGPAYAILLIGALAAIPKLIPRFAKIGRKIGKTIDGILK